MRETKRRDIWMDCERETNIESGSERDRHI